MSVIYCPDCDQRIIDNVCACAAIDRAASWRTATPADVTSAQSVAAKAIGGGGIHVEFTEYNVNTGQVIIEVTRYGSRVRWMIEPDGNADLLHDQHESE